MDKHLIEEQNTLETVSLSETDDGSSSLSTTEEAGRAPGMQEELHTTYIGEEKNTSSIENKQLILDPSSAATDASENGGIMEAQNTPGFHGDCCPESPETQSAGSPKVDCLSGGDSEQHISKTDDTNQALTDLLHDLKEHDHMKRSDGVCSESPYDTDCTKNLISTIQNASSHEAFLEEIEAELLSTDLLKGHKLPNGVCKSETALAVFEKCMQDKYVQQEHTIKK